MADNHACGAPVGKKAAVARGAGVVILRAIGEAVLRSALHWMIRRAQPHMVGDSGKAAYLRVRHVAVFTKVGEVAQGAVFEIAVRQDLALLPHKGVAHTYAVMNKGLLQSGGRDGV
ncbi:hypothetical protein [Pantoea piersonii]|uniref:hypothetical protein n=1 Tax=Pantoea piersonii TaxID=2364647 RepID=UPI003A425AA9